MTRSSRLLPSYSRPIISGELIEHDLKNRAIDAAGARPCGDKQSGFAVLASEADEFTDTLLKMHDEMVRRALLPRSLGDELGRKWTAARGSGWSPAALSAFLRCDYDNQDELYQLAKQSAWLGRAREATSGVYARAIRSVLQLVAVADAKPGTLVLALHKDMAVRVSLSLGARESDQPLPILLFLTGAERANLVGRTLLL